MIISLLPVELIVKNLLIHFQFNLLRFTHQSPNYDLTVNPILIPNRIHPNDPQYVPIKSNSNLQIYSDY